MGLLAAVLGWVVTDVSCRQPGAQGAAAGCNGWSTLVAIVSFLVVTIGVVLLLVLVYRSIAEWQQRQR